MNIVPNILNFAGNKSYSLPCSFKFKRWEAKTPCIFFRRPTFFSRLLSNIEFCLSELDKIEYEKGLTQYINDGRKVNIKFLYEDYNWINAMICGYGLFANCKNFNYKLSKCDVEGVQLSQYKIGQFYNKHVDFNGDPETKSHTRKLSMSVQLSENNYEGGDLIIYYSGEKYIAPKSKGTVIVFDSKLTHEVTPITKGERYSLVKWFHGDEPLR